jgi:hypothetical protein
MKTFSQMLIMRQIAPIFVSICYVTTPQITLAYWPNSIASY